MGNTIGPVTFNDRTVPQNTVGASIGYLGSTVLGPTVASVVALGNLGGSPAIPSSGVFSGTLNVATTAPTLPSGLDATSRIEVRLLLTTSASAQRYVRWPANVTWVGNAVPNPPQTTTERLEVTFVTYDGGTTWIGSSPNADLPGADPLTIPGVLGYFLVPAVPNIPIGGAVASVPNLYTGATPVGTLNFAVSPTLQNSIGQSAVNARNLLGVGNVGTKATAITQIGTAALAANVGGVTPFTLICAGFLGNTVNGANIAVMRRAATFSGGFSFDLTKLYIQSDGGTGGFTNYTGTGGVGTGTHVQSIIFPGSATNSGIVTARNDGVTLTPDVNANFNTNALDAISVNSNLTGAAPSAVHGLTGIVFANVALNLLDVIAIENRLGFLAGVTGY